MTEKTRFQTKDKSAVVLIRTSDYGQSQTVVIDRNVSVDLTYPDRWQFRAVRVGKGIEVTRHPDLHGWVDASAMREWCKAVGKLAKYADELYFNPHTDTRGK